MKRLALLALDFLLDLLLDLRMNLNVAPPALPGEAGVKAVAEMGTAAVDAAAKIEQQDNTPSQNLVTIEDHRRAVHAAADDALAKGDVAALQRMLAGVTAKLVVLSLVCLSLIGCAGSLNRQRVFDDPATMGAYDASTPPQYNAFNSGLLFILVDGNKRTAGITANRAKGEPTAQPYTDKYGNHIFTVDGSRITGPIDAQADADAAKLETAK